MALTDPVPSKALDVFERNSEDTDRFVTGESNTFVNRLGVERFTITGILAQADDVIGTIEAEGDAAVKSTGWFVVGEFTDGFEYTAYNQVGRDADGELWSYNGSLPFTVTAGTVPSEPDYTNRGDAALRSDLADDDSEVLIAGEKAKDLRIEALKQSYHYSMMGKAFPSTEGVDDPFASWTHATIAYDEDTDDFVIVYNTSSGHQISENSVLIRKKSASADNFTDASIVASDRGNYTYKCQAFGIAPNGDYVALVARSPWGTITFEDTVIYRSTDKGQTWSTSLMQSGGSTISAFNGDVSGFLVTLTGRILTLAVEPDPSYLTRIFYSDDNGITWQQSSISGSPTDVTEPAWCDVGGGVIVCMARASVRNGSTTEVIPAKFMVSNDNGETWSQPVDSQSITNFTLSNGEMIPDYDKSTIEFIHHSRYTEDDNYSSLLISRASFDDAVNDNFSPQLRIGKLAAYTAIGNTSGDSGYVGAKKSKNGVVNAFYYTGTRQSAQISYLVGLPNTHYNANDRVVDPMSGEVLELDNTSYTKTPILLNNTINSKSANAFTQGFTEGTARLTHGTCVISVTGADGVNKRRSSIQTLRSIDFSEIERIVISVSQISIADLGVNDFAVALYDNTFTTSNPKTGRKFYKATSEEGELVCDVSGINGEYQMHVVLTSDVDVSILLDEISLIRKNGNFEITEPGFNQVAFRNGFGLAAGRQLVAGFTDGTGSGDEDLTSNIIRIGSTYVSEAYRRSFRFENPIPAGTRVISCRLSHNESTSVGFDAGIAVFNKTDPSSPNDGRIAFKFLKSNENIATIYIPSANASDTLYLHLVVNATESGASADVYFDDIICYS